MPCFIETAAIFINRLGIASDEQENRGKRLHSRAATGCHFRYKRCYRAGSGRSLFSIAVFLMPKMNLDDLQAMLASEKHDALAAMRSDTLSQERADAMDYYLGDMSKHMPVPAGRSSAVSTDVADVVEGILPHLMDIFFGSDEVVRFEPVGPEDEEAALQETDYVNHVFMQRNNGFMVGYTFIKDALLSKTGIVKIWWEENEQEEKETYFDLDEEQYAAMAYACEMSDGMMKIVEHTVNNEAETPQEDAAEPKEEAYPA